MIKSFKLGIAGGLIWGISMFVITLISIYTGYAELFLNMMSSIYPGYTISGIGSIIGLIYGFFDCFTGLFFLGWLYNLLNRISP